MRKSLFKLFLVLAVGAVICLPGVARADLSWQTAPIMGHLASYTGDVVVDTDAGQVTIPHVSMVGDGLFGVGLPSVTTFYYDPGALNPVTGLFSGSGIWVDIGQNYHYNSQYFDWTGAVRFTDTAPYYAPSEAGGFVMNYTGQSESAFGLTLADAGLWHYTETWMNDANSNDTITFTQQFNVTPIPLPPSALLLGSGLLGLIGLGWRRRKS